MFFLNLFGFAPENIKESLTFTEIIQIWYYRAKAPLFVEGYTYGFFFKCQHMLSRTYLKVFTITHVMLYHARSNVRRV